MSLFFPLIQILVLFLMRGHHVPGTTFSLGSLTLPSIMGISFAFGGMIGVAALLMTDREDDPAARQGHAERHVRLRPREDHL